VGRRAKDNRFAAQTADMAMAGHGSPLENLQNIQEKT
jgi:hypothetical protein